jgi:hypothetical protein
MYRQQTGACCAQQQRIVATAHNMLQDTVCVIAMRDGAHAQVHPLRSAYEQYTHTPQRHLPVPEFSDPVGLHEIVTWSIHQ